ncbi:nucleoside hydrolase [Streptomyces sp. NPDC058254]|uniref:nucleoside hydrolase n=1 Tax=Streptomyces sp. NPDC058254 TaxID=3346406 RepID=UPI0036E32BD0
MTHPEPVVIDCDPGIDDAVALMLAFASPELDVTGITTVAGNVGIGQVVANALALCDLIGVDARVPVLRGHAGPLARAVRVPDEPVHGAGGLGGVALARSARTPHATHAVEWLAGQLRERGPAGTTVIATAPLTNIASLLHAHPEAAASIKEIVLMGGAAFAPGNVTPSAEFNFFADPEAARFVTEAGVPLRIVGLDVTRKALTTRDDIAQLLADGAPVTDAAGRMLAHLATRYEQRHGVAACAVHDALAVAAAVRPGLLEWTDAWVTVECGGEFSRGKLIADVHGRTGLPHNAKIATGVDTAAFRAFLTSRLLRHYGGAGARTTTATDQRPATSDQ